MFVLHPSKIRHLLKTFAFLSVASRKTEKIRDGVNCHGNTHNKAYEATSVFCLVALQWILDFYKVENEWVNVGLRLLDLPARRQEKKRSAASAQPLWVNVVKLTLGRRRRIDPWNDVWHWIRLPHYSKSLKKCKKLVLMELYF